MARILSQSVIRAVQETKPGAVMEGPCGWWLLYQIGQSSKTFSVEVTEVTFEPLLFPPAVMVCN